MSNGDSSHPDKDDFEDLENELKRLIPSNLDAVFQSELEGERQRVAANDVKQPIKQRCLVVALTMVACLLLMVIGILQWRYIFGEGDFANSPAVVAAENFIEPRGVDSLVASDRSSYHSQGSQGLLPVSSQGYLIDASSGRVVRSEGGNLQRQLNLQFQDVDHWHDPSTSTDIRIYSPRREVIQVPLRTD